MGDQIVRVGLVGAGAIAQVAHLPAYQRVRGVHVVALCDSDAGKTDVVAQRYGVKKIYYRYEDLLDDPAVDVVDVCTPSHHHHEVVMKAVEAGKDVICEKPLALNAEQVKDIVAKVKKKGRKLLVAFNNRFRLDTSIIKGRIERGDLGRVTYIKSGWIKKKYTQHHPPWALSRKLAGGGAFMDMGIHLIDAGLWLLGYPRVERLSAFTYTDEAGQDVEDGGLAFIVAKDHTVIAIEVSWGQCLKEGYHYLNVYGDSGSAHLEPFCLFGTKEKSIVERTPKISKSRENIFIESYRHEIEYFAEVLRDHAKPPPADEQVILHEVLDAIYLSAGKGQEISLK
jgi:predicted dehydrogenase